MLTKENFNESHIRMLQKQSKKDPALLERAVFAFGLLEAIRRVEMPFIFKGGTCLILLLKHPMRLSTDIDIIVAPDTDVDTYISKASTIFPFKQCEEQVRIGRNSIEKTLSSEEYPLYVQGIRDLRGHIYAENYSPETAVGRAAKVMYMAACLLKRQPYKKIEDPMEFSAQKFYTEDMKKLKYLRKVNLEAYGYAIKAEHLMNSQS